MDFKTPATSPQIRSGASDLSRLCLPQAYQDPHRRLAWVNSICCLFLIVGLFGLKPPPVHTKPLSDVPVMVPVVITAPEEQPPKLDAPPPETETPADIAPEQPVVATVVAAETAAAAFAIPVSGPVILAPARYAAPPPIITKTATDATKRTALVAAEADWGGKSDHPEYPLTALRKGRQGKVILEIYFDGAGTLLSVKVLKSSGDRDLDFAARDKVQRDLRLKHPTGAPHIFTWEVNFQLE